MCRDAAALPRQVRVWCAVTSIATGHHSPRAPPLHQRPPGHAAKPSPRACHPLAPHTPRRSAARARCPAHATDRKANPRPAAHHALRCAAVSTPLQAAAWLNVVLSRRTPIAAARLGRCAPSALRGAARPRRRAASGRAAARTRLALRPAGNAPAFRSAGRSSRARVTRANSPASNSLRRLFQGVRAALHSAAARRGVLCCAARRRQRAAACGSASAQSGAAPLRHALRCLFS